MIETKEDKIDGFDVRTSQHPARAAARLLAKVGRSIGPALGALRGVKLDGAKLGDFDVAALGPALSALFESMKDTDLDALIADVLSHTTIVMPNDAGKMHVYDLSNADIIDAAFTGNLPLMMKVIKFALGVNFASFFPASVRDAAPVKAAESPSLSS